MKAFIIHLPQIESSRLSALEVKKSLSKVGIKAKLFAGSNGNEAKKVYTRNNRFCHAWGLKGPGVPVSQEYQDECRIPGIIGCFDSHYRLWELCVELNEPIMIFEDDVIIYRPYHSIEWQDVLSLAFSHEKKMAKYQQYLDDPTGDYRTIPYGQSTMPGNGGYAIKPHAAKILIDEFKNSLLPADNAINQYLVKIELHSHMMGRARSKTEGNVSLIRTRTWDPAITIACVLRSGGKVGYNASWVEKLQNGLERNLTIDYNFVALSDCEVPCDRIRLDETGVGWWAKMQLFKPSNLSGPVLFLDLDTVIVNNLDELIMTLLEQKQFVMWRDDKFNISSSAIMYWNGDYSHIYETYMRDPAAWEEKFALETQANDRQVGDQALISSLQEHVFINDLVPRGWIRVVSKYDSKIDFSDTRLFIFRKAKHKPSTLPNHPVVKKHWR